MYRLSGVHVVGARTVLAPLACIDIATRAQGHERAVCHLA
jgi:hypothetical protein